MKAILKFPLMVLSTLIGIIYAILTESDTLLLLVWSVLLGFLTTPLIGVVGGLGLYLVFRLVVRMVNAILPVLMRR